MPEFNIKVFNTARTANGYAPATLVGAIDDNNVILAWRDRGTYKGRSYDKYRIGIWYWSTRNTAWQQSEGSLAVPYEYRDDLLKSLAALAKSQLVAA